MDKGGNTQNGHIEAPNGTVNGQASSTNPPQNSGSVRQGDRVPNNNSEASAPNGATLTREWGLEMLTVLQNINIKLLELMNTILHGRLEAGENDTEPNRTAAQPASDQPAPSNARSQRREEKPVGTVEDDEVDRASTASVKSSTSKALVIESADEEVEEKPALKSRQEKRAEQRAKRTRRFRLW